MGTATAQEWALEYAPDGRLRAGLRTVARATATTTATIAPQLHRDETPALATGLASDSITIREGLGRSLLIEFTRRGQ